MGEERVVMATTHILLLRGVMPKGKNKVPMAQLREALTQTGLQEVRTYIQSGNVLLSSEKTCPELEALVHDVIAQHFGGDIRVVAREVPQFRTIMERNPFQGEDTERQYFTLMASQPSAEKLQAFLAADYAPETVKVVDDVIYALYATKVSDSKYHNNYFENKLRIAATTRNYNTMMKLVTLSAD